MRGPIFRIFNPVAPWKMSAADQRDCGVLAGKDYPAPIVNHTNARRAVLEFYGKGLG